MKKRSRFRELHDSKFIIPNPWDAGSARLLASLGFEALATTSAGHAASLGRLDGEVTRDEAIEHARAISNATPLPVSADLENGFGDTPEEVAATVELATDAGLAGCSIEDCARDDQTLYERALAVERVRAAVTAAQGDPVPLVLTARAENYLRGNPDLADTIGRLQQFQEAGADVLYAPGLRDLDEIRRLVAEVDRPVNVLLRPDGPSVPQLAEVGVRRVSVGGALGWVANAALLEAARELHDKGTAKFWEQVAPSLGAIRAALSS